jgi:hypothetical protein
MAGLAAVGGIVSGVAGAAGGMMQGNAQASQMETQANIKASQALAKRREGIAEQGAKSYEVLEQREQHNKLASDQRARFASSGGGITGSAQYEMEDTRERGVFKEKYTMWQGLQMKQDADFQASILDVEAAELRKGAQTARTAGAIGAIGAGAGVLTGMSKIGGGGSSGGSGFFYG